jgi:hypothetical protein
LPTSDDSLSTSSAYAAQAECQPTAAPGATDDKN